MRISVIILAAGQGKRMNAGINKQFLRVLDKPILAYTIERFYHLDPNMEIVLVVQPGDIQEIKKEILDPFFPNKEFILCFGGEERYHSVYNGLSEVSAKSDYILIHDGARPLVSESEIINVIDGLKHDSGCILGVRAKNTYKVISEEGYVLETLPRAGLYSILTPQGFRSEVIREAYEKGIGEPDGITDDSMMVEKFTTHKVRIVEGSYENIKVTTPDDLMVMENLLKSKENML